MRLILLLATLFFSLSIFAQTEADIRKHSTDVNKKITESIDQGFEGPLYNNQWIANKNGRSWPAVGYYADTVNFWYDDPPDHLPAAERNPKNVLLKVHADRKASHLGTHEEYLFKDGKLLFYYSHEGEEGSEWETRVWFNNKGVAFKTAVKANGKELSAKDLLTEEFKGLKPSLIAIQANAKKYQDLFIKSML
jgi:hypothetical protein